jgi:hypothetical protein
VVALADAMRQMQDGEGANQPHNAGPRGAARSGRCAPSSRLGLLLKGAKSALVCCTQDVPVVAPCKVAHIRGCCILRPAPKPLCNCSPAEWDQASRAIFALQQQQEQQQEGQGQGDGGGDDTGRPGGLDDQQRWGACDQPDHPDNSAAGHAAGHTPGSGFGQPGAAECKLVDTKAETAATWGDVGRALAVGAGGASGANGVGPSGGGAARELERFASGFRSSGAASRTLRDQGDRWAGGWRRSGAGRHHTQAAS